MSVGRTALEFGKCSAVRVANLVDGGRAVRDSNDPAGPALQCILA